MYKDFKKTESLDTGFVGGSGIIWMFSGIVLGLLVGLGMYYLSNAGKDTSIGTNQVDGGQVGADQTGLLGQIGQSGGQNGQENLVKSGAEVETPEAELENRVQNPSMESISVLDEKSQKSGTEKGDSKFSYYAVLPTLNVPISSAKAVDTKDEMLSKKAELKKVSLAKKEDKPSKPAARVKKGRHLVQMASFKRKSRANTALRMLKKRGIKAYVQRKKIKGRVWYRIVAGPVDQSSAELWKKKAEKLGHKPLIIQVK